MKLYQNKECVVRFGQVDNAFDRFLSDTYVLPFFRGKTGRVADLGCGGGRNLVALAQAGFNVVAMDYHDSPLRTARAYARENGVYDRVKILKGDLTKLKKGSLGKFDYCVMQEVIEHIPDYQKAVDFAYSCLKPGGTLILTTQVKPECWTKLDDYAQHVRRFRKEEVLAALKKSGFKNISYRISGFPFHRLSHFFYQKWLVARNEDHDTSVFVENPLKLKLYSRIYPWFLKIDPMFDFTELGKNIITISQK